MDCGPKTTAAYFHRIVKLLFSIIFLVFIFHCWKCTRRKKYAISGWWHMQYASAYCINRLDAHNNITMASRCTMHDMRFCNHHCLFTNIQCSSWIKAKSNNWKKNRDSNPNLMLKRASQTNIITNFIKTYYNKIKSATLKMANKTFNTNGFFDFNYCFMIGSTLTEGIDFGNAMYSRTLNANKPKWIWWMHFIIQIKITATMDAFIGGQALLFVMYSVCKIM